MLHRPLGCSWTPLEKYCCKELDRGAHRKPSNILKLKKSWTFSRDLYLNTATSTQEGLGN